MTNAILSPMTTKKPITLEAYAATFRTQEEAARSIPCPQATLNRWIRGKMTPRGFSRQRLEQLGIGGVRKLGDWDHRPPAR
jgi:hypothetical protein